MGKNWFKRDKTEKREKVTQIAAILYILLALVVKNSKCSNSNVLKYLNIDKQSKLHSYSMLELNNINKNSYKDSKAAFTFIKDLSCNSEYSGPPKKRSEILVGKEDIRNTNSRNCILSWEEIEHSDSCLSARKRCRGSTKSAYVTRNVLIVPHNTIYKRSSILELEYLKNKYFKSPAAFKDIESATDYAKDVFSTIFYKQYIKKEIDKVASFTTFLENNNITQKKLLEDIGLKNTFIYEIVGRFEAFSLEKDVERLYESIRKNRGIFQSILEGSKEFKEIIITDVFKTEDMYKENTRKIYRLIDGIYRNPNSTYLLQIKEEIKRESEYAINLLCNGKLNLYTYIAKDKLKQELRNLRGFEIESRIITEIINTSEKNYSNYILIWDIEKEIEKQINMPIEKLKIVLSEGYKNIYSQIDKENLKNEASVWDRELVSIFIDRYSYFSDPRNIYNIKEEIIKTDRQISSEVERGRNIIYNEYKIWLIYWIIYNQKIQHIEIFKHIEENIEVDYKELISSGGCFNKINDATVKEIIYLLSYVSLYKPSSTEFLWMDAMKKQTAQERSVRIGQRIKEIHAILNNIEKEFLNYGSLEETIKKIKEEKKKIFLYEPKTQSEFVDENMVKMINYINLFISLFVDILVDTKLNHFNSIGTIIAKNEISNIKRNNMKSPEELRTIVRFIGTFHDDDMSMMIINRQVWNSKTEKIQKICQQVWESIRTSLIKEKSAEWFSNCIEKEKIDEIYVLTRSLDSMNRYCNAMRSYTEMWTNPAFLVVRSAYNPRDGSIERKGYIIYRSSKNNKIYEKIVDFSNENFQAFKNAKTSEEIENIPTEAQEEYYGSCCIPIHLMMPINEDLRI